MLKVGFIDYYLDEWGINKIDGEYQLSPVFVNLESNTKYTVTVRVGATDSSFASETYQVEVTTK